MSARFQPDRMPGYALPVYPYRKPPELAAGKPGEYPVIVVGGGLGGLTAALELGSRGVATVVLDEDDTVGAAGLSSRGICYAKHSLEILARFDVASRIVAKGVTWNEGDVFRAGERLYRFNLQPERDQQFPAFVNLQQFYVEQYLVEAIGDFGAIDLRWKNRVVGVKQRADHIEVEVETPDGRYTARARYLVAADGAHSVVRDSLGARDAESALFEDYWCIADVRMAREAEAIRKAYLDSPENDGGAIWYHQMADGVWRTDWQIIHYPDPDAETAPERARERLKKLLGPATPFELIWVGGWRFRKRYLEKMVHGRVLFLGDASAQHSPFGARGGNRAIQDANNLGWKLARVLAGESHPDLVATYHDERHVAARECVEHSTRAALFIGPESDAQRLVRNAILDLAQNNEWARALVNVGRLSVATCYAESPLNGADRGLDSPAARPGAAAPDGRVDGGFLAARLQGGPSVLYFGGRGAEVAGAQVIAVPHAGHEALFERYAVRESATYVVRPDGHVLARSAGIDARFAAEALAALAAYRAAPPRAAAVPGDPLVNDRVFDVLVGFAERTPPAERERALKKVFDSLGRQLGELAAVRAAIGA